jgi:tripartite-type tricarboxylate transporter receptor subunit TctC
MSPYGLAGPRGMPPAIVQRLHDAFKRALFDPVHVAELARFDQEIAYLDGAAYGRSMREAFEAERRIVERLRLAPGAS